MGSADESTLNFNNKWCGDWYELPNHDYEMQESQININAENNN